MSETQTAKIVKTWESGDFVYGAVRTSNAPSGLHYAMVGGREYPVARLNVQPVWVNEKWELSYSVAQWMSRNERYPEPMAFNR